MILWKENHIRELLITMKTLYEIRKSKELISKSYYYETNLYIITKHFSYDIIRAE